MLDRFQTLIDEFGEEVGLPLQVSPNRSLAIHAEDQLILQIEESDNQQRILLAIAVAPLPAGKFREEVLLSALQYNSILPRLGTLAYLEERGELILFHWIPFHLLTGLKLADLVERVVELSQTWKRLIETGGASKWVSFEASGFLKGRLQEWMIDS